jgi:integrase
MNRPRRRDKHLPRSVYFRHGAFYYVRGGKWTRIGKSLREALGAYAAIQETPSGSTSDLIDQAMAHIVRKVSKNTEKQYLRAARHLKVWLQEFDPQDVQPRHVAALKLKLAAKPNWANRCLSLLRQVFDYALEQQLVQINPAVGVKRHPERKRTRLLSLEEYQAIYDSAGPRLQVIMDLCIRTGQRVGDVLAIRRSDLTAEGIRFEQMKTGNKGVVAWSQELRSIVERAKTLDGNIRALTLLHNRRGKAPDYSTVKIQWDKARSAAGVPDARLHDLRALAATWAKKQGKNPTALLMHSSPAQTVRYLRDKEEPVTEGPSFGQSNRQAEKKP